MWIIDATHAQECKTIQPSLGMCLSQPEMILVILAQCQIFQENASLPSNTPSTLTFSATIYCSISGEGWPTASVRKSATWAWLHAAAVASPTPNVLFIRRIKHFSRTLQESIFRYTRVSPQSDDTQLYSTVSNEQMRVLSHVSTPTCTSSSLSFLLFIVWIYAKLECLISNQCMYVNMRVRVAGSQFRTTELPLCNLSAQFFVNGLINVYWNL